MEPRSSASRRAVPTWVDPFRVALDETSELMAITRVDDGVVVAVNRSFAEFIGRPADEIIGDSASHIVVSSDPQATERFFDVAAGGRARKDQRAKIVASGGDIREICCTTDLINYEGEPCIFFMAHEITEEGDAELAPSRLVAIVTSSSDAIIAKDLQGRIAQWNRGAERLYGWSASEAIGRPITMIIPPERIKEFRDLMDRVSAGERIDQQETVRLRRDGTRVPVSVTLTPIPDGQGKVIGISAIGRDLSNDVAAEIRHRESEGAYKLLVETSLDAIVGCDLDLRIHMANKATLDLLHLERIEDVFGHNALEWIAPEDLERAVEEASRVATEGTIRGMRFRIAREDGTSTTVEVNGSVSRSETGEPTGFVAVMRDVSGSVKAEEEMAQALEREMEAVSKLEALDRLRNTFLEAVSHELRTPLTAVLGLAESLRDESLLSGSERQEFLDRLVGSARKLERLLVDLLDIERLERGIVEPTRRLEDLAEIVRSVLVSIAVGERTLTPDLVPVRVMVDRAKIERIVENLIANAVRHTPPGTTISVRTEERAGNAVLMVEDDAGDLSPSELEQIFEPFTQGSLRQSHSPGLGIGLSLVAGFTQLHGGRAWAERREEGGVRFCVSIPIEAPITLP